MKRLIAVFVGTALLFISCVLPALAKPIANIPPGTWKGSAVVTGSISKDFTATYATPLIIKFEFTVQPDGTVTNGLWNTNETTIIVSAPGVSGSGKVSAGGSLGGTGAFVTLSGTMNMEVTAMGITVPLETPAAGGFQATTANCTVIYGDMADQARQAQQAAGFSTSVMGPFTATRIAAPGQQGVESWNENYVELFDKMNSMLDNIYPKLSVKEVLQLVKDIELFQANLIKAQSCPDLPKEFKKDKQPYTYFVEKFTEMMNKILDNPAAYSGAEICDLLWAAHQLGVLGSAAPDEQAAQALRDKFFQVLGQKINEDIAKGDKSDAKLICVNIKQGQENWDTLANTACAFANS